MTRDTAISVHTMARDTMLTVAAHRRTTSTRNSVMRVYEAWNQSKSVRKSMELIASFSKMYVPYLSKSYYRYVDLYPNYRYAIASLQRHRVA